MVHIPRSDMRGQTKIGRMASKGRQKQMESIRHTVESSIKNALARKKMNGQAFAFTVDGEGNVTEVKVQSSAQSANAQIAGSSVQALDTTIDRAEDFADDELFGQSMTRAKAKQISRTNRGRGRGTVRRDTTSKSAYPYPQSTAVSTPDSNDEAQNEPRKQHRFFQIRDEKAVTEFLHSRLKGMQQLADKKIAKAWIKSICPKKQANFPYQNKKTGRDGKIPEQPPTVPGWWPDRTVCRFTEPDHIKKTERMDLCLHLLRLRPDTEQLKAWNGDKTEPNATHRTKGWTAFLQESAGTEIFDELPKEDKARTEQKKLLMRQMYDVAQLEQDFLVGACDGATEYTWEEDQEEKKATSMRKTRSMSVDSNVELGSRQSSASVSCTRGNRVRQITPSEPSTLVPSQVRSQNLASRVPEPRQQPHIRVEEHSDEGFFDFSQADKGYESAMANSFCTSEAENRQRRSDAAFISQCAGDNMKRESSLEGHCSFRPQPQQQWKYEQDPMQWTATPQTGSSFMPGRGSHMPGPDSHQRPQPASTNFPGRQDFVIPQYPSQGMIQVQQVNQVPEPQFHAVPNTSVFSPQIMAPMPLSNHVQYDGHLRQEQAYTTTMAPSPFFMPGFEPGVADFQPPMAATPQQIYQEPAHGQPQYHHHQQPQQGLAQRHIAPMQYHGFPFDQPTGWPRLQ